MERRKEAEDNWQLACIPPQGQHNTYKQLEALRMDKRRRRVEEVYVRVCALKKSVSKIRTEGKPSHGRTDGVYTSL